MKVNYDDLKKFLSYKQTPSKQQVTVMVRPTQAQEDLKRQKKVNSILGRPGKT